MCLFTCVSVCSVQPVFHLPICHVCAAAQNDHNTHLSWPNHSSNLLLLSSQLLLKYSFSECDVDDRRLIPPAAVALPAHDFSSGEMEAVARYLVMRMRKTLSPEDCNAAGQLLQKYIHPRHKGVVCVPPCGLDDNKMEWTQPTDHEGWCAHKKMWTHTLWKFQILNYI